MYDVMYLINMSIYYDMIIIIIIIGVMIVRSAAVAKITIVFFLFYLYIKIFHIYASLDYVARCSGLWLYSYNYDVNV